MTTKKNSAADIDLLQDLVARARKAGADAADAVAVRGGSLSHARRLGKIEKLERSEGQDLGLRVLLGRQQAVVSSNDRSPESWRSSWSGRWRWRGRCRKTRIAARRARPDRRGRAGAGHARPGGAEREMLIERARAAEEAALAAQGSPTPRGPKPGGAARASRWSPRTALPASIPGRARGSASR